MDLEVLGYVVSESLMKILPMVGIFLVSVALLLIGLLLARILKKIIVSLLKIIHLDDIVNIASMDKVLEKGEIKKSISELLGDLIYWVFVFTTLVTVTSVFGLDIYPVLNKVLSYFGIVVIASAVLGLGVIVASLIANVVFIVGANLGIGGSRTIAKIIQYAFIIFAFLVALEQMGIGSKLLEPSIGVIIGSVGLALAIAFGLGCKDMLADFVSNLVRNK